MPTTVEHKGRQQPTKRPQRRQNRILLLLRVLILTCIVLLSLLAYSAIALPLANSLLEIFTYQTDISTGSPGVLQGRVVDRQRKTPLAGVKVTAGNHHAVTNWRGNFTLAGVPPGSMVQISAPGFEQGVVFVDGNAILPLSPTATEMTRRYLVAFQQRRYGDLWDTLHPDVQAQWTNKRCFINFYSAEYHSYEITDFTIGPAHVLSTWRNLAFPQPYQQVVASSVALKVVAHPNARPVPTGLFDSLAFTMVKSDGRWYVLFGGPTGPAAPLLMPQFIAARLVTVPILMYHHVTREPPPTLEQYYLTVNTTDFARQMDYLAQEHYHPITMSDLLALLYYGKALPSRPIILSFDDGYSDAYSDVLPVLLQHSFRATFPIITRFAGQQVGVNRYMTWTQIRELTADGMEITSHTVNHADFNTIPLDVASNEISFSRLALQQQLQQPIELFTYPYGEPFRTGIQARQQFIKHQLEQAGYIGALLDQKESSQLQNAQAPFELPRIRVLPGITLSLYATLLTPSQ